MGDEHRVQPGRESRCDIGLRAVSDHPAGALANTEPVTRRSIRHHVLLANHVHLMEASSQCRTCELVELIIAVALRHQNHAMPASQFAQRPRDVVEQLDRESRQSSTQRVEDAPFLVGLATKQLVAGFGEGLAETRNAIPVRLGAATLDVQQDVMRDEGIDASRSKQCGVFAHHRVEVNVVLPQRVVRIDEKGQARGTSGMNCRVWGRGSNRIR